MTVKELIEELREFNPDAQVIYQCCSDYRVLEAGQVSEQTEASELNYATAVEHHNMPGEFRMYSGPKPYGNGPLPKPAKVVIFPGN